MCTCGLGRGAAAVRRRNRPVACGPRRPLGRGLDHVGKPLIAMPRTAQALSASEQLISE